MIDTLVVIQADVKRIQNGVEREVWRSSLSVGWLKERLQKKVAFSNSLGRGTVEASSSIWWNSVSRDRTIQVVIRQHWANFIG